MKKITLLLAMLLFTPMTVLAADSAAGSNQACTTFGNKIIVGQKEWVTVLNSNQKTIAKVDTGATTSSINATEIKDFEKDGKDMVSFKIKVKDQESETITLPVVRWVHIKQSSSTKTSRRPIIELNIKLGDKTYTTPFNLVDRDHMVNAILLGRSFLTKVALVDVEQKYLLK
ncbi:ATP-dependent zinc protease family protein [Vibrio algicola]|uniref:Retropepsin-like aspartic endopeptidase domain-containing protein n=1 Tax=Vibrio algicola TaxID=2662262 RepID=A0A5Q0TDB6_9VIBR|nr:RimK/LysX family protein [Vibrio algicola]